MRRARAAEPAPVETGDQQSLLDIAVGAHGRPRPGGAPGLAAAARRARHPRRADARPRRRPRSSAWSRGSGAALGGLVVPLGTVDRPREQRRDTLSVDLSGGGRPRSPSSVARAAARARRCARSSTGMALTTTPQESQFFVLDFGGGTFAGLTGLPHVAGVGTRSEPDVVSRIIAEVTGHRRPAREVLPGQRHRLDRDLPVAAGPRLTGPGRRRVRRRLPGRRRLEHAARRLRRPGDGDPAALDPRPHLRPAHRHRHQPVGRLPGGDARHVRQPARAAAGRPARLRDRPADRRAGARRAARVAAWWRASCTSSPRCRASTATPAAESLGDGVDDLVRKVSEAWTGPAGPKLRLLPERITLDDVRGPGRRTRRAAGGRPGRTPATGRHRREGAGPGLARPGDRAAPADPRRRPVRQELGPARPGPRDHADPHAAAGPAGRRRLPPRAAGRGAGRVPPQLPHFGQPGPAGAARPGDLPREPDPRPRRHPGTAARPVVVDRRRGVRAGRRLRPGRHPAELTGRGAAAAAAPRPATSGCT